MIRYSPRSACAIGHLKRYYNDIEVFVEDTTIRNVWFELIKNMLPHGVKLQSINQLGGRRAVIQACRNDQKESDRKRIYIIDADFDRIRGYRETRLKHLHQLNVYCVENLLLSEEAFSGLASALSPNDPFEITLERLAIKH